MSAVKKLSIADLRSTSNAAGGQPKKVELNLKPGAIIQPAANTAVQSEPVKPATEVKAAPKKPAFKRKDEHVVATFAEMKKSMATMKTFAPLIGVASAIAENPEDIGKSTQRLVDQTYKFSDAICELAGIDPLDGEAQWLRSQALELSAWQVSSNAKRSMAGIDGSLDDLLKAAQTISELPTLQYPNFPKTNMSLSVRLKMTTMKSVMGLTRELASAESVLAGKDMIEGFRFDKQSIIKHASQVMFNTVADVVAKTEIKVGDEETKMTLFQGMMNHASSLYTSAAIFHIDRLVEEVEMAPMTKKKDFAVINLEEIDSKFLSDFGALVAITIDAQDDYVAAFSESSQINRSKSKPSRPSPRKRFSGSDI